MHKLKWILFPFAALWWMVLRSRHFLYDLRVLPSERGALPSIVIGNLELGGTGKTPHALALLTHLKNRYTVAFLSRGYGRNSSGFRLVHATDHFAEVGDEPLLIARRCKGVHVAVCENRREGITRLKELFPELVCVVLDDAFQHRSLNAEVNILLTRYSIPFFRQWLLPIGKLRDIGYAARRAHVCVISGSPAVPQGEERSKWQAQLPAPAFFTGIAYGELTELTSASSVEWPTKAVVVAGIAHPDTFFGVVNRHTSVLAHFTYGDHHHFTENQVREWTKWGVPIITTEKDAVRLLHLSIAADSKVYYLPIALREDAEAGAWLNKVEKMLFNKNQ